MGPQRVVGQVLLLVFSLSAITVGGTLFQRPVPPKVVLGQSIQPHRVLIIGGSAARGWKDEGWMDWKRGWQGGYLVRSFQALSEQTGHNFVVFNKAIPGLNATMLATRFRGRYETWLHDIHPNIVVISWGMMNDTRPHTPMPAFKHAIQAEIQEALKSNAAVLVVTPPITTASYTVYRDEEPMYVNAEMSTASSLHDARIHVIDLFNQMKEKIADSGETYRKYEGDLIHPNALGHLVASQLLVPELRRSVT